MCVHGCACVGVHVCVCRWLVWVCTATIGVYVGECVCSWVRGWVGACDYVGVHVWVCLCVYLWLLRVCAAMVGVYVCGCVRGSVDLLVCR